MIMIHKQRSFMKMFFYAFAASLSILMLSCASSPKQSGVAVEPSAGDTGGRLVGSDPAARPEWLSITGYARQGGKWYFVGESSRSRSDEDARAKALLNGLALVSSQFGVKVSSELVTREQDSNGNYSYDIGVRNKLTGAPIRIKDYKLDGTYVEKWDRGAIEFDARALIAIPDEEIARIRKEIEALCGWGVLSARPDLQEDMVRLVKEFAQAKKLNLQPNIVAISDGYSVPALVGQSPDAAFFLVVKVPPVSPKNVDGEWYADVAVTVEYLSLTENKVVSSFSASARGAAYGEAAAVRDGFLKAFQKMIQQ